MKIKEIQAKSILRSYKRIDSWFVSCYAMNIYRGCIHNCVYCDGRSEKYQVKGSFGNEIEVKTNAIELLNKELRPSQRKKPLKKSFFMVGGGVGDSYQPVENKYKLTQKALHIFNHYKLPISLLTKSTLIERDIDILKQINEQSRVLINMSFSSTNDEISKQFEPGVPTPTERLDTLKKFKDEGFSCGVYLLPVIPFITDTYKIMKKTIHDAARIGIDYIIFGGMTIKKGDQKNYFMKILNEFYPDLYIDYENIYLNDKWGQATQEYNQSIHDTFNMIMNDYHIPKRIPPRLFHDILSENDNVSVILDQLSYLCTTIGKKSPYGFASYQISQLDKPISQMKYELQTIKGIGPVTSKIIQEILEKGTSDYYEELLFSK